MTEVRVTGPDAVDRKAASSGLGLSWAVTFAARLSAAGRSGSYYVRDGVGELVGRADADGTGGVLVYGERTIRAYRVRQLDLPDLLDRAAGSVSSDLPTAGSDELPLPAGRPEGSTAEGRDGLGPDETKGVEMAAETKVRSRSSGRSSGAPTTKAAGQDGAATAAKAAPAPKAAPAAKAKHEDGRDLMQALMHLVEERVPGAKQVKNNSGTYFRLQVGGKTFAYIFPPRPTGLAVKIPKQLLAIERDLPKDHGFHATNWGLTRTITKASEAPKVAASFAVAAAAVQPKEEEAGAAS